MSQINPNVPMRNLESLKTLTRNSVDTIVDYLDHFTDGTNNRMRIEETFSVAKNLLQGVKYYHSLAKRATYLYDLQKKIQSGEINLKAKEEALDEANKCGAIACIVTLISFAILSVYGLNVATAAALLFSIGFLVDASRKVEQIKRWPTRKEFIEEIKDIRTKEIPKWHTTNMITIKNLLQAAEREQRTQIRQNDNSLIRISREIDYNSAINDIDRLIQAAKLQEISEQ